MMTKNTKRKISSLSGLILLIIILDLIFLYFNKYRNQNLDIIEFNLFNFGNLVNLFFTVLLLVGLLIATLKKSSGFNLKLFFPFFLIYQFLLILIYLLKYIHLPFKGIYYLGQTGDELLVGTVYTFYTFILFVLIFLVWLNIFKINNAQIIRAMLNSTLLMIFILLLVFFFIIGKEASFNQNSVSKDIKNIAVVLGAAVWSSNKPSPSLASRVDKAFMLYEQKRVSRIYLTGSNAPGEKAESEVALNYIKSKGIRTSDIFLEKETTSTNEQIQYIKKNLISASNKNVIVVSDGYHLVRALEIAKFHNINIQVSASDLSQSFEQALYIKLREALALTMFWLYAL